MSISSYTKTDNSLSSDTPLLAAGLFIKHAGSVFCYLQKIDGIKPSPLKHSARDLSLLEREKISRELSANLSFRAIARNLNRATSTVSREIYRNGGLSKYRTVAADKRVCKLNDNISFALSYRIN
ncbi:helix-turn-helix domain-containing protein [Nitrosomonas ureae]|uniref:helix-turn-helix domain-containing protein n=1 Tax=Nitrosomonas ureae TaxID=44577 RepID=UPI000BB96D35|nr:helix-turn-helix domain-containing protein [Nitrosomonas ureae]